MRDICIIDNIAEYCHYNAMIGFGIYLKPSAVKDMDRLRKYDSIMVADGMEIHLSHNPTK